MRTDSILPDLWRILLDWPLEEWLRQRQADMDELQTAVDRALEAARQAAKE